MFSKNWIEDSPYIKQDLTEYFSINYDLKFPLSKLYKSYGVKGAENRQLFDDLLAELIREKVIVLHPNGTYQFYQNDLYLKGTVDFVNPNYAFVNNTGSDKDIYIPHYDLKGAVHGDLVKVFITKPAKNPNARPEGKIIEIISREVKELVGTIQIKPHYAFFIPDSKKFHQDFYISKDKIFGANDNEKVIIKILDYGSKDKSPQGEVIQILGKSGENETELNAIITEFGLPKRFPEEVESFVEKIPTFITPEEIKNRKDFRPILTFTIDPVDAKDFDDAISYQELANGHMEIGVHIADVSHYVQEETILDKEAYLRGTSIYLVDRVIPMLPEKLSNELCSLRPNEDKLTFSAVFEIRPNGEIVNEWFGRTIIHSDKRFTYEEAQGVLDGTNSSWPSYETPLQNLNRLAKILRAERFKKGSVNFETVELKFQLDENGKPVQVYPRIRKDAHKLIEEWMLLANKQVALFVFNLKNQEPKNTMVYRVHEAPDPEKLKVFSNFAKKFGYKISIDAHHIADSFNQMMEAIEGKKEENLMQSLAVRTMAKARYSTDKIGHFGLAFPFYSHFTSPIRRYPDLIAHRLLQNYLLNGPSANKEILEAKCKHCSDKEKIAADAERASIKYKQVEYISLQEPQVFKGTISGITENGIYVELENTSCEGMIKMGDLVDDYYELDKENYRIVGRRTKRIFTFGDEVEVLVKETNLTRRTIDLELVGIFSNKSSKKKEIAHRTKKKSSKVIPRGKKRNRRR